MKSLRLRLGLACLAPLALALQGCATPPVEVIAEPAAPAVAVAEGPGLWKVADEDTTVYLFGTVHALPEAVDWYSGPIAEALGQTDQLVTEIPSDSTRDPALQRKVMEQALLPEGESMRDRLSDADRQIYEAALVELGMPPAAFDQFKPWFAAMTLSVVPLVKAGYTAASGVEMKLEQLAPDGAQRDALETLEQQIELFDTLSPQSQQAFLRISTENVDEIVPMMDSIVAAWLRGDADGLAAMVNEGLTDAELAEALLYRRNAAWADWIDARLDQPGTVFVAVGAGHLAGAKSVQDYLAQDGLTVTRVQ